MTTSLRPSDDPRLSALLPLARKIAGSFARRFPHARDDVFAAATIGAWKAAQRHPAVALPDLLKLAAMRIRGEIIDELRRWDWATRRARAGGDAPPMLRLSDLPPAERQAALAVPATAEDDAEVLRHIAPLRQAMARLPERSRAIIEWCDLRGLPLTAIGQRYGITEARISQLRKLALAELRAALRPPSIAPGKP